MTKKGYTPFEACSAGAQTRLWGSRTGEGTAIDKNTYERSVLLAALDEIDAIAAPRQIDRVSAIVGMDMVEFAKLGPAKMQAVIWATLQLKQLRR